MSARFDNRFVHELPGDPDTGPRVREVLGAAWSQVMPTPVRAPQLLGHSREVAAALGLEGTLGHVIDHAVAGDVAHGVGFGDVAAALPDHHAEFHFPIGARGAARDLDIVIGADDGARPFVEDDRLLGDLGAGFGGVIGIVEADTDELADPADTRSDAWIALDLGQASGVDGRQARQAFRRQHSAGNVVDMPGKIANSAFGIQKTRFFLSRRTVAQQFHPSLVLKSRGCGAPPAKEDQS